MLVQRASAVLEVEAGECTADARPSDKALVDLLVYSANAYFLV